MEWMAVVFVSLHRNMPLVKMRGSLSALLLITNIFLLDSVNIRGAMASTTYCKGTKLYVYGTFLRLTPTSPSPSFDQHRSSLFFSITEKNESSFPPKSRHLILRCRPLHEVVYNFRDAVARGQHEETRLHCPFFFTYPCCPAKWELSRTKIRDDHIENRITEPGSKSHTEHHGFVNSNDATALITIKARCPKPPIAW